MPIDPDLKAFATAGNFAALTTMGPNDVPSTHIMWVDADDDHVLVNTEVHRQKFKNMTTDPRVAVTVVDASNPYRYIEARGRVVGTVGGDEARAHIDHLSRRYRGGDYTGHITTERVVVQIAVDRVYKKDA